MDTMDRKILEVLQEDGRASNAAIARRLGVSEGTVRRRIKLLETQGYCHVTAVPNLEAMGKNTMALLGVQTDPSAIEDVAARLAALPQVHFVSVTTGAYDVFATVAVGSPEELHEFLHRQVGVMPGVRRLETFLNLRVFKRLVKLPSVPDAAPRRRRSRA